MKREFLVSEKYYIKTFGCQMNVYDSSRIADMLKNQGYEETLCQKDADIVLFNTCHIREKAAEKLFSDLGRAHLIQLERAEQGKQTIIGVAGCVVQAEDEQIVKRAPYVNFAVGPLMYHKIAGILHDIENKNAKESVINTEFPADSKFDFLPENKSQGACSFLAVQEGCNNFCTYCVVPFTRGREFSRDVKDILNEAKHLVDTGVKEITLIGQNVNSFCGKNEDGTQSNLAKLLFAVADISGLKRLRYTTSNPQDLGEDVAIAHRDISILAPFLHLPVQAGSNEILRRMNRKYTIEEYLDIIDMLRSYRPDIAFSSDFIVGFPGETDADFAQTLNVVKKVKYAQAYSFKYSPRPKTAAANMPNQIAEKTKEERLAILQNLLNSQQDALNKSCVGTTQEVLFTKTGRHEGQMVGRSEYFQAVTVNNRDIKVGDMRKVKITSVVSHSIIGETL